MKTLCSAGLVFVGAAVLAVGCGEKSPGPIGIVDPGGYSLEVERSPFRVRFLSPAGEELTVIEPGGLGVGRVASFSSEYNYDPYLMVYDFLNEPHEPPELTWLSVDEVIFHRVQSSAHVLEVRLSDGTTATLRVGSPREGVFRLTLEVPDAGAEVDGEPDVVFTYLEVNAPEGENYYGMGQVFQSVAHRGRTFAMQSELWDTEALNNEANLRIPLLVSSGSWGIFADSMRPAYFDIAESDPTKIRTVVNEPVLELYLMAGADPLEVTEHYTAVTAAPAIPPVWAFAPIQWRNEIAGQAEVLQDASDIRARGVPTGSLWIDRPYQSGYNTMEFDPGRYPDPAAMVQSLHDDGFRLAGWNTPYLEDTDPDYPMAEANGWFVEGLFVFTSFGKLLDLTNPDVMAFWQARVAVARDRGIEGWKLDYAQDIQTGISDARMHFGFWSGEDERTMNRRYAEYYHRAYAEPLGLPEVFILARAGTIGGQAYASVIWPGDLDSDFKDFLDVDSEGTTHVGGLPSALRAGTCLAVSGYPFFASDTGGYRHNRPSHEVMVRWTEYSALLPIMQYGGGGDNHNPWDFTDYGDSQFNQDTLDIFRRYATLHIRLFPYFYSYARQAHASGRPVIRPFGLQFPRDGRHPDDAFFSGPDLLVAPVIESATQRTVPLPAGSWIDWWTSEVVEGPVDELVDAPLDTLPLYLRAGGIVPMLRPTVQTLSPVSDPSIDTYDGDPGRLWGRVAPEAGTLNRLVLHDLSELGTEELGGAFDLWFTPGSEYTGLRIQVFAPQATQVELDGATLSIAADVAELDTCQACWLREGAEPWIWLALAAASTQTYTFHIP
ncbi:MAG: TIM-barrel domain-containing protein [bacterium]